MIFEILLLCGISSGARARQYQYVRQESSWTEAQTFCRLHHHDLATITAHEGTGTLRRDHNDTALAWVGLRVTPWRWTSSGHALGGYTDWKEGAPPSPSLCVAVASADVSWFGHSCSHKHPFLCYTAGSSKQFHYIATDETWVDAGVYCRLHHTDLAEILSRYDSSSVSSVVSTQKQRYVWIGLKNEASAWSDGTAVGFTNFTEGSDDDEEVSIDEEEGSVDEEQCVAEGPDHRWVTQSCGRRLPFFCQGAMNKRSLRVKMTLGSRLDLLDGNEMKRMLLQMEEALRLKGVTNVTVTTRSVRLKRV